MSHTLYLPIVRSSGASWGCQVDYKAKGLERYILPGRAYQTPARWIGLDPWFESNVQILSGSKLILGVKTTPEEYRLWTERANSPPKEEHYGKFADFAVSLRRYCPWAVELYNEPDVPWEHTEDPLFYGGWIKSRDDNYYEAGLRYGEFTRAVYTTIKASGLNVIGGALSGSRASLEFAQGMRDAGFAADYVSFHTYITMTEDFDKGFNYSMELQDILDRPLIWNETNLLGDGGQEHRKRQAEYMRYVREQSPWSDIAVLLWYSFNNWWWWHCGLIENGAPTPAYAEWAE